MIQQIYFLNEGLLVSLQILIENHSALEIGLVGSEGVVGLPWAQGIGASSVRAVAQGTARLCGWTPALWRNLETCPPYNARYIAIPRP